MEARMTEALALLERELADLVAVYVFGSAGTVAERPDSDIDVAFLARSPVDPVLVFDVAGKLTGVMGRDVDLVDLSRATTVMRAQVVSRGTCVLDRDRYAREIFEVYTYSSYARLNEERAGILEDIHERGSVHG